MTINYTNKADERTMASEYMSHFVREACKFADSFRIKFQFFVLHTFCTYLSKIKDTFIYFFVKIPKINIKEGVKIILKMNKQVLALTFW